MLSTDRAVITAQHNAFVLTLISAFGTTASLLAWLFAGWFWALCGLVLVCTLLSLLLFGFVGAPATPTSPQGVLHFRAKRHGP
jgi:hypothetical protein